MIFRLRSHTSRHAWRGFRLHFGWVAVLLGMASCGPEPGYVAPAAPPDVMASVTGVRYPVKDVLLPNATFYVVAIDGQMLGSSWVDWNRPVPVAPGSHEVEFSACLCGAINHRNADFVAVTVDFAKGGKYFLAGTAPGGPKLQAYGWVADADGAVVSRKIALTLWKPAPPVPIFIPVIIH